jgi:hypothetical protein
MNCESYVKAANLYDRTYGVTFSAYLGRAIYNQFNRCLEKEIRTRTELGMLSYDGFGSENEDFNFLEVYAVQGDEGVISEKLMREEARKNIATLSSFAKLVIRELLAPSEGVLKTHEGMIAHSELAKKRGETSLRVPNDINIRTIKLHYGFRDKDVLLLKKEIKKKLGVDIGR